MTAWLSRLDMRVLMLLAVGIALIAINLWYFRSVKRAFFGDESPAAISPFQIVSADATDDQLGTAMAHLLRARLSRIRQEMESSARSLEAAKIAPIPGGVRPADQQASFISIPNKVFEPLAIDLSVAGVEVGGLLSWAHRLLSEDRMLRVVVEFQEDKAIVGGNFDRFGGSPLYLVRTRETDKIITGIAYTIMQLQMSARIPEVGALDLDEFQTLITALHKVADLNRKVALGRLTRAEYEQPLKDLGTLVEKTPQWRALLHLTAQVAENAHDMDQALRFYQMEMPLVTPSDPGFSELAANIDQLSRALVSNAAEAATIPPAADSAAIVARLRKTSSALTILAMVGVDHLESKPRVAILGGLPTEGLLPDDQQTVLGSRQGDAKQRRFEAAYIDSLVQTVQLVAPRADFIFAPMSGVTDYYSDAELVDAWQTLMSANPDALLVTFGPLLPVVYEPLMTESVKRGIHVVFAETPADMLRGVSPVYESETGVIVVSSVRLDGQPLGDVEERETMSPPLWAPGENIPTVSSGSSRIEHRMGNSYAAAIAAGIVGAVAEAGPDLSLHQHIDVLRTTARSVASGGGPPVLNLEAALEQITATTSRDRGQIVRESLVVNAPIPDNDPNGVVSKIHIDPPGIVRRIRVNVRITHVYIGDLGVKLSSPDGDQVTLHDRSGGSRNNLITTYSSDALGALSSLVGKQGQGDWLLQVSDLSPMDLGSLDEWSLQLEYTKQAATP